MFRLNSSGLCGPVANFPWEPPIARFTSKNWADGAEELRERADFHRRQINRIQRALERIQAVFVVNAALWAQAQVMAARLGEHRDAIVMGFLATGGRR